MKRNIILECMKMNEEDEEKDVRKRKQICLFSEINL